MKKIVFTITVFLTFASLILTSCTADTDTSLVDSYKADAQEYVDEGDIDSAIKTLKKGIEKTGNESLEDMLDMLESLNKNKVSESDMENDTNHEDKEESTEDYSRYSGSWSYSDWFEDASFSLDIKGNKFDISGKYYFYDFINDTETVDATFSASSKITDGVARIDCTDSYGTPFSLKLTFTERQMTNKTLDYITCDCISYNGKTLAEIFGGDYKAEDYRASFYNEESRYIFETLETIALHCEDDYNTGYFSDGGSYTKGGNFVDFVLDGNNLTVHYTSVGSAPYNRIAEINRTVDLSTAISEEYTVEVPFDEDGWGNSGVLNIRFSAGNGGPMVYCSLSEMVYDPYALWSISTSNDPYDIYNPDIVEPELIMSDEERRTLNIFLSNFCETDFYKYNTYNNGITTEDEREMMYFAFEHIMINTPGKVQYLEGGVTAIHMDDVTRVLNRFLGKNVPALLPDMFYYQDGYFLTDAITHLQGQEMFAIATAMLKNNDGTINVKFELFRDSGMTDSDIYSMTLYEAENECGASYGNISAIIKEKTYNGQATYELVSYNIYW